MHALAFATHCLSSAGVRSTFAITSIASAVPAAEVIAREDVLGIIKPCAATIGITTIVTRLPGSPPRECLSTTMGRPQSIRGRILVRAFAIAIISSSDSCKVHAIRKACNSASLVLLARIVSIAV